MRRMPLLATFSVIVLLCVRAAIPAGTGADGPAPFPRIGPAGPGTPAETTRDGLPDAVAGAVFGVVSLHAREAVAVPVFRAGRFHREQVEGQGAGSGVIVSADGLILTNAHVVEGTEQVRVTLATGREVEGRVVSIDPASDLALVRAPTEGAAPLSFAGDDPPPEGVAAYVIGNRRDRGAAVLPGRIGPARTVRTGSRPIEFWRQVEAPVQPGDSGGALVDARGRLLGMPALRIASFDRAETPSGLFIPTRHLRRALSRLRAAPRVVWPWIGLLLEDPLIDAAAGEGWDPAQSPRIREVLPQSPAARAGFHAGDRLVAIGGRPVGSNAEALDATLDLRLAVPVEILVQRDGARLAVTVTPVERPADPRPDPIDDFALHTGLRLTVGSHHGRDRLSVTPDTVRSAALESTPDLENEVLSRGAVLETLLPGRDLLDGARRGEPLGTIEGLAELMPRCFVSGQFVALILWVRGGDRLERAYVHRKIDPLVL